MSRLLIVPALGVALALAACGGDDDGDTTTSGGGGSGGVSVELQEPSDGDDVSVPFTFVVESSEELGTTDSGNHHVHLYFDGDDTNYEVIESGSGEEKEITADSPALEGLDSGEHTVNVSLRNADHSAAGAEDEITVELDLGDGGGSGDDSDDGEDNGDDGGSGY